MREIIGFPGYFIDTKGNVFSYKRKNIKKLTPHNNDKGYLQVKLSLNNRSIMKYIHRLLAESYIEKVEGKDYIDHIDRNSLNNDLSNLRWADRADNMNNRDYVRHILQFDKSGNLIREYKSVKQARLITGIHDGNIGECIHGRRKTAGKFIWRHKE